MPNKNINSKEQSKTIQIRFTEKEKHILEEQVKRYNFRSICEYFRFLGLNKWNIEIHKGE